MVTISTSVPVWMNNGINGLTHPKIHQPLIWNSFAIVGIIIWLANLQIFSFRYIKFCYINLRFYFWWKLKLRMGLDVVNVLLCRAWLRWWLKSIFPNYFLTSRWSASIADILLFPFILADVCTINIIIVPGTEGLPLVVIKGSPSYTIPTVMLRFNIRSMIINLILVCTFIMRRGEDIVNFRRIRFCINHWIIIDKGIWLPILIHVLIWLMECIKFSFPCWLWAQLQVNVHFWSP